MKVTTLVLCSLLALPALASSGGNNNGSIYTQGGYSSSSASAGAAALSSSSVQTTQLQAVQVSQGGASVSASVGGASVSASVHQDYGDPAPAVAAPAVMTSSPCFVGYSGGFSVAGFGASGGGGVEDKKCTLRETSRVLHAQGEREASVRVMCMDGVAALALGPKKCAGMPVLYPADLPKCHADAVVAKRLDIAVCE